MVSEAQFKMLMIAGTAGDNRAYHALLTLAAGLLRRYFARRLAGNDADVEDLVQDTLIAVHRKRSSYKPALPFTAWLHGIARYRLIDHFRRVGRRPTVALDDDLATGADEFSEPILAAADIEALLSELPEKQAAAIRLTRLEGLSTREAAARSGQSEPAIKVNVHRGIGRLMARIGSEP
jgi:RNA polymerase sigma-70 factor (ECF subfamily)